MDMSSRVDVEEGREMRGRRRIKRRKEEEEVIGRGRGGDERGGRREVNWVGSSSEGLLN